MTVPEEIFRPNVAHDCSKRFNGWAYRYLLSNTSTQTEIPSLPLGIKRAGTGALTIPGDPSHSHGQR
jgi:hypothetical protein